MTDAQKSTVLTLRSKGMSFSMIAETVGLSVNTIKSFCSRHKGQLPLLRRANHAAAKSTSEKVLFG
mgnify:CR=1 FL=1